MGQLGIGKSTKEIEPSQVALNERASEVTCGISHTCVLTDSSCVYSFGCNTFGQLGTGNKKNSLTPLKIKIESKANICKISCGHYSAAVNDEGELYIWGTGSFGEFLYHWLSDR